MPRQAREKSSTGVYHIMLRGINRQGLFEDEEDYLRFVETISYYKSISQYCIYAYCLMDNHVHLLLKEGSESLSNAIKRISSSYVHWYNGKYERSGHLFQERFKSEPVESESYLLTVIRYIHQNPLKAGIANRLEEYLWTSYHEYISNANLIDIDFILDFFSKDRAKAIELFGNYCKERNDDCCLEYHSKAKLLDKDLIGELRKLGVSTISEFQSLKKEQRNDIIRQMKNREGITIRQLSRITGVSKSVIDRI